MKHLAYGLLVTCAAASGCGSAADDTGHVEVRISGQEFVRTGWPTKDGDDLVEFDDGWSVRFEHVAVCVQAFRLAEGDDEVVADEPSSFLVDLRQGEQDLWSLSDVPAQRWPNVGYRFARPDEHTTVVGPLAQRVEDAMRDEGYSLWIEGTAEKDDQSVTFRFGIPAEVTTDTCLNGRDETDGIVVGNGRVSEVEVTLHMDHLFWDDHDAEEPRLLFGPLAHAAGDDGIVTLDDLAEQRLTDLRDANGDALLDKSGVPIVYVPRVQLADNNLREYMIDTALTLGHFNGEGHCAYTIEP